MLSAACLSHQTHFHMQQVQMQTIAFNGNQQTVGARGNRAENKTVRQQKEENLIYCRVLSACS